MEEFEVVLPKSKFFSCFFPIVIMSVWWCALEYWAELIEEFVAFRHGKHTDQIDAFTQMADYVKANGALAKPVPTMSEFPMAMAGTSQASGYPHLMSTADHKKPGICVGRGNSLYAPYGRSWVVR